MKQLLAKIVFIGLFFPFMMLAEKAYVVDVTSERPDFTIILPANPTTGFEWTIVSYDKTKLTLLKNEYVAPKPTLIGAGGGMVFKFITKKTMPYPNSSVIIFKYVRAWEPKSAMTRTVRINFTRK